MSRELALRADLLVSMEQAGAISATGCDLSARPDISLGQFEAVCRLVGRVGSWSKWAAGDLVNEGEKRYGEACYQALAALNMSPEGLSECARVARAIPRNRRRASLSWSTHRAVAKRAITPRQRDELLDRAVAGEWSARQMEEAAKQLLQSPRHVKDPGERGDPIGTPDCETVLDELLAATRMQLADCGYGPDVALELVVRAPGMEYRIERGPGPRPGQTLGAHLAELHGEIDEEELEALRQSASRASRASRGGHEVWRRS